MGIGTYVRIWSAPCHVDSPPAGLGWLRPAARRRTWPMSYGHQAAPYPAPPERGIRRAIPHRLGDTVPEMAPPNPFELAAEGVRTLQAFGRRIPVGGGVLAPSLKDRINGRIVMITGASS